LGIEPDLKLSVFPDERLMVRRFRQFYYGTAFVDQKLISLPIPEQNASELAAREKRAGWLKKHSPQNISQNCGNLVRRIMPICAMLIMSSKKQARVRTGFGPFCFTDPPKIIFSDRK
jgi:hypothetical protein